MRSGWQGWFAAVAVTLVTVVLVILDLTVYRFRHWWAQRALTTDTVGGLLVLLITVLVADQVVRVRQIKDRSRATAAQVAIVMSQANRSAKAVSSVLAATGERESATDEVRTYMTMLLLAGPLLIDARLSRTFLEQAQHLAAELARALANPPKTPDAITTAREHLGDAVDLLRNAANPLLQVLNPEQLNAADGAVMIESASTDPSRSS